MNMWALVKDLKRAGLRDVAKAYARGDIDKATALAALAKGVK